tara:strand:+ start:166 stop:492 length:327 start_codon:yes stop_codon:yes gene_type:complete
MSLFTSFRNKNSIISDSTSKSKTFSKDKKLYYRNVLKYLDEHLYFNYLKLSDPLYGLNFETQLPYYLQVNVGISVATIIYQRKYPDHEEISPVLLYEIKENLKKGIFT